MGGNKDGHERGLTRRQLIKGTGGVTALTLGVISLDSAADQADISWDHETDILVVGSGAAASCAAVTAHQNKDDVLMVEKAPVSGGTAMKSAGVLWIPNNFSLKEKGIDDKRQDCLNYMARFSYPQRFNPEHDTLGVSEAEYKLLEAFYDNASLTVDALRNNGDMRICFCLLYL